MSREANSDEPLPRDGVSMEAAGPRALALREPLIDGLTPAGADEAVRLLADIFTAIRSSDPEAKPGDQAHHDQRSKG